MATSLPGIWRALLLLAVAIAASAYMAIPPQPAGAEAPSAAPIAFALQAGQSCPNDLANPLATCLWPAARNIASSPVLSLCPRLPRFTIVRGLEPRPSLCGKGFHPQDRVYVMAASQAGSTLWAVHTDAGGGFNSLLPAPLCRVTPATVSAIDMHGGTANSLTLRGIPCPRG